MIKDFFTMLFGIMITVVLVKGSLYLAKYINLKLAPNVDGFLIWLGILAIIFSGVYAYAVRD